jgi:Na+/H+-dicarboxylate symporter
MQFGIFSYVKLFVEFFTIGIFLLWVILLGVGYLFFRKKLFLLLEELKSFISRFSTTSSEAVFPINWLKTRAIWLSKIK